MISLTLCCNECGAREMPRIYSRWAPNGTLLLQGTTQFYVDGARVRCPEHTDPELERLQRRSRSLELDMEVA